MKNSNVHAILSDVHRILSQYTPDDLVAASRYLGVSEAVRSALLSLAREAAPPGGRRASKPRRTRGSNQAVDIEGQPLVRRLATKGEIVDLILASPRFTTSGAIRDYVSESGFKIRANPKDGRQRLARRLADAVWEASDAEKAKFISSLDLQRESQTEGWIGVIKSPRR